MFYKMKRQHLRNIVLSHEEENRRQFKDGNDEEEDGIEFRAKRVLFEEDCKRVLGAKGSP